jgi:hypothetical protein
MKLLIALGLTLAFVVLLLAVYYLHVLYVPVEVVLYSAILDGLVATLAVALALWLLRRRLPFTGFEKLLLILLWALGGYAFAISVPTVLDRSLSFYILEKLDERGGGIKLSSIPDVFTKEYINEFRLVDVRLTEQLQSGTITIDNGCVKLTDRGRRIAEVSSFIRKNLLPKHRLLMGQYTDALTDPFAASAGQKIGYECQ